MQCSVYVSTFIFSFKSQIHPCAFVSYFQFTVFWVSEFTVVINAESLVKNFFIQSYIEITRKILKWFCSQFKIHVKQLGEPFYVIHVMPGQINTGKSSLMQVNMTSFSSPGELGSFNQINRMRLHCFGDLLPRLWPLILGLPSVLGVEFFYHNFTSLEETLRSFSERYPKLTRLHSIGKSVQGINQRSNKI